MYSWKEMFPALANLVDGERLWLNSDGTVDTYKPRIGSFVIRLFNRQNGWTVPAIEQAVDSWGQDLYDMLKSQRTKRIRKNNKELINPNIPHVIRGIKSLMNNYYDDKEDTCKKLSRQISRLNVFTAELDKDLTFPPLPTNLNQVYLSK